MQRCDVKFNAMEDIVINELPLLKLAIAYFTIVEIGELGEFGRVDGGGAAVTENKKQFFI